VKTRIPIKYSKAWAWLLTIALVPRGLAYIEIDGDTIRVRMSWAFRARFTRGDISAVVPNKGVVSIGVHGWKGRWLVNGSHRPIARITFALPTHARVLGVRVTVRELLVSVDDVAQLRRLLLT
jgi:hypothetical protein